MANDDVKNPNKPNPLREIHIASPNRRPKRPNPHPSRINFVPQEFEHLVEDQGCFVRVTPVILCPNKTDLGDTNHVLDCPLCFGDEVIEVPDKAVEDWALIQAIDLDKKFEVQGIFDIKDAKITTKQTMRLYYWYKIEVLDFSSIYNQLIKRGNTDFDKTRYIPAVGTDTQFNLVDANGKFYEVNKHYRIDNFQIHWKTAVRPENETLYSLSYPILPTFRVLEMVHENRYYYIDSKATEKTPVQLPQQAIIRWDYLARRSGQNLPNP